MKLMRLKHMSHPKRSVNHFSGFLFLGFFVLVLVLFFFAKVRYFCMIFFKQTPKIV